MKKDKKLTTNAGAPVVDNQNIMTAGPQEPVLLQDVWFLEKLAHFDREVIPERRMHAKGSGAYGTFTVTHDITCYTKAKIFSKVGNKTELFTRFSTVAGERGAADAFRLPHPFPVTVGLVAKRAVMIAVNAHGAVTVKTVERVTEALTGIRWWFTPSVTSAALR